MNAPIADDDPDAAGHIRPATLDDLETLVAIEQRCFETDRLSRRSFRHFLTRAKAVTLLHEIDGAVTGYALVLFHAGTALARLYSFAVLPERQGLGIGARLLAAAEAITLEHGYATLRLEVRADNTAARALYQRAGYREMQRLPGYYEDHADGLRLEKTLESRPEPSLVQVPFYEQTLEFTCGPAALMMAMRALDPTLVLDRKLELRLWREATTIFMTSGHGGCGPYGLALAAHRRGFAVTLRVKDEGALFVDSVRSPEKKAVIALVQEDQLEEIRQRDIRLEYGLVSPHDLERELRSGGVPLVMISSYRLYGEKFPHWVVVTGFDEHFLYVHDPYVDYKAGKTPTDCVNLPILKAEFTGMARYGRSGQRAVIIVRRRAPDFSEPLDRP
ncbi:MAG TPA: GNAT family N-acetyltransferase/peptidase C39 family protein [Candidatus Macondimonas sp.]|nr:GNAT family N-acetyltransferase/peptidase C39 family protein [Candidatus Macondimonas sp.]